MRATFGGDSPLENKIKTSYNKGIMPIIIFESSYARSTNVKLIKRE